MDGLHSVCSGVWHPTEQEGPSISGPVTIRRLYRVCGWMGSGFAPYNDDPEAADREEVIGTLTEVWTWLVGLERT